MARVPREHTEASLFAQTTQETLWFAHPVADALRHAVQALMQVPQGEPREYIRMVDAPATYGAVRCESFEVLKKEP